MKHSICIARLKSLYEDDGLTTRQIAAKVGIPARTVTRYLNAANVRMRNVGPPTPEKLFDEEWLRRQYVDKRRSTPDIAKHLGCAAGTVLRHLVKYGIESRTTGSERGHSRNTQSARRKMSLAKRDKFIGEDNPNWKGGNPFHDPERGRYRAKIWTKAVKDRDGWKCTKCGSKDRLHAHHIKKWANYPELRYDTDNGVTLCHSCHEKVHGYEFRSLRAYRKAQERIGPKRA